MVEMIAVERLMLVFEHADQRSIDKHRRRTVRQEMRYAVRPEQIKQAVAHRSY
jgi:hypothetical protein